jgi:diketogulonate reductase-like aldo/keto reductase
VIPIPGTRRPGRVEENAAASGILLDETLVKRIDDLAKPGLAEGATLL